MTPRRLPLLRLLAALAVLTIATGCGLTADSGPETIARENLPPDLLNPTPNSSTTLPESSGTTSISVFFVERVGDRDRLTEAEREVADATLPADRLAALLLQPTQAEMNAGLTTTIPADTVLLDVGAGGEPDELVINLSSEFYSRIQGEELAKAFAQIVWTVTELADVQQVRFQNDGTPIRAQDAEGVEKDGAVTRADYAPLAPR